METIVNQKKTQKREFIVLCFLGAVFLFVYAISTSPIASNFWGSDSAFFQAVGKNLNRGLVMYKDIFDIKGPYLFFIEYLGYSTGMGRYGIFVIEIVNMCVSLLFLQKSVYLVAEKDHVLCLTTSLILFFFLLSCTLDCGNLSEEYALPYLLFCLFLYLRYKKKGKIGIAAFGFGVSFAAVSLGRVTNSVFICILALDVVVTMSASKSWNEILKSAGLFLAGTAVIILPFFAYYAQKGALSELIEAVYLFSFSYATESTFLESIAAMRWPIVIIFGIVEAMAWKESERDRQARFFLIFHFGVMLLILTMGNAYIHYYQLLIPSILAAFWLWWDRKNGSCIVRKKVIAFLCVVIGLNLVYFVPYSGRVVAAVGVNTPKMAQTSFGRFSEKIEQLDSFGRGTYGYRAQMQVDDILEKIPEDDRASVYNYATNTQWLLLSGLKPYNKYCTTADHFACLSKKIENGIKEMFETHTPKYIVTNADAEMENPFVKNYIQQHYSRVCKNDLYALYQVKALNPSS